MGLGHTAIRAHEAGTTIAEEAAGSFGLILRVAGELDLASAPALRERLDRALDAGVTAIVLDFEDVTFIDSVSLAAVVAARSRLGGDRLAIVASTPFVTLVLEASGLVSVLDVFDHQADAIAFAFG